MAPKPFQSSDAPWQRLKISKEDLQDLKNQWAMLHAMHHRSHNQHRRSAWYGRFNIFRKQLRALLDELDPKLPQKALFSLKVKVFKTNWTHLEQRLEFWADVMVEKWYLAFSQLISDTAFAVLGVTLFAILGRVVVLLRLLDRIKPEENLGSMKEDLKEMAEQQQTRELPNAAPQDVSDELGVAVQRPVEESQDDQGELKDADEEAQNAKEMGVEITRRRITQPRNAAVENDPATTEVRLFSKAKERKKRKRGDEIDDLFSGLL